MPFPEFRAWDGEEMIYISDSAFWSLKIEASAEWVLYYKSRIHCRKSSETGLMQYLGIEDVEGEQIFEGDILRNESGAHGLVWWNQEKGRYYLLSPDGDTVGLARETIKWDAWRIIGNVHENPEIMDPEFSRLMRHLKGYVEDIECPVCGGADFTAEQLSLPNDISPGKEGHPLALNCTRCHHVMLFHMEAIA